MSRFRNVCVTINNYDGTVELDALKAWDQVSYCIVAREVGESGTPHLQCYIEFKQQVMLSTFKKKVSPKLHCERREGTPERASNYCKKGKQSHAEWKELSTSGPNFGLDADFEEWGEMSKQGNRTDLEAVRDVVSSGESMRSVCYMDGLTCQGLRSAELLMKYIEPPRSIAPIEVIWASGPDAVSLVFADNIDDDIYEPLTLSCWDGYDGHSTVHLRILDVDCIKDARYLQRFLDKYPFRVSNKGSSRQARYTKLYVSTPEDVALNHDVYWQGRILKTIDLERFVTRKL